MSNDMEIISTKDAASRAYSHFSHSFPQRSWDLNSPITFPNVNWDFKASTNVHIAAAPYSQAIKTPTTIYCSGQIPTLPTGEVLTLEKHNIGQLTEQCCKNLSAVLTAAGSSLQRVVKVNVFITTMDNFAEMNATYEKFFSHKPARSCVAVKELPKGVPVEIECIALV